MFTSAGSCAAGATGRRTGWAPQARYRVDQVIRGPGAPGLADPAGPAYRGEVSSPQVPDGKPTVYRITDARKGITEDVNARQRRYLISMGIRTVCFILAIIASGWLQWLLVIAALLLPYIAVIIANAGREPAPGPVGAGAPEAPPTLPAGPTGLPGPDQGRGADDDAGRSAGGGPHSPGHSAAGPDEAAPGPVGEGSAGPPGEGFRGGDTPH
jgi:hypothetical protein